VLRRFGESLETSEQEWLVWEINQKIAEAKGSAPTLQDMPPEEPPEVSRVATCALDQGQGMPCSALHNGSVGVAEVAGFSSLHLLQWGPRVSGTVTSPDLVGGGPSNHKHHRHGCAHAGQDLDPHPYAYPPPPSPVEKRVNNAS
jgi:hypothetical protein